ncbi:MAG: glycoside hydrolase family 18 protein [Bacillota bacterium]
MTKRKFLVPLIIAVFFTAIGFLSGMLYSNQLSKEAASPRYHEEIAQSGKIAEPKQMPNIQTPNSKVLIGYVQDFRDPDTINLSELTHIIFSFAHPTKDGGLILGGETALKNLQTLVQKAHNQDKKVMLAVGGWFHLDGGESYDYFKTAIQDQKTRTKLVNELISLVERENLDGIDIDFEHPRSEEDAKYLAGFTEELSRQLKNRNKQLSIAVNAKVHSVAGTEITSVIYEPDMFKYVDYVNIMAYDGQWDGGYNAANLSPFSYTENIVTYWSELFIDQQIPTEKLVLGVPFYAQPEDPQAKQISYATIIKHDATSSAHDKITMNGTIYHFNGMKTMERKTKLALDYGFGGMMLWEAGHDAQGPYSLTASISDTLQVPSQKLYTKQ